MIGKNRIKSCSLSEKESFLIFSKDLYEKFLNKEGSSNEELKNTISLFNVKVEETIEMAKKINNKVKNNQVERSDSLQYINDIMETCYIYNKMVLAELK